MLENTAALANILFEFTRGEEDKDIFMEKVLKVSRSINIIYIISKEWKKFKDSGMVEKCKDLHET